RRLHRDAALLDPNAVDALSDVLKSVRLEGAVYLNAEFTAPWCIRGELGLASVRERLAGAEHVAFFHFLTEGGCKVRLLEGTEVLEASAGDLVLFPQEGRHLMGTDLQLAPMEGSASVEALPGADPEVFHMRHGGGGTATRFICGYLALSRSAFRPLFEALPRGAPGKDWAVDEVGQEVARSRSALAERFASLLGEPPMQYLTRWRLALAARMLREGREPIIRIAERSGYESEGAFSRAFKR